jgi:hypothetical protein
MHMWHHVTNHLITSNDKDSNSENRIKLRIRDMKVSQSMVYPADHPSFHNQPKGIKNVLLECGFNVQDLCGKCKKCDPGLEICCCKHILECYTSLSAVRLGR